MPPTETTAITTAARPRSYHTASPPPPRKHPWYTPLLSLPLRNHSSVARDHLALERTFLAWLRTSLAFASIGIAITQLFRLNNSAATPASAHSLQHVGKPLGVTFLGVAVVVLGIGVRRYFEGQRWLLEGKFPASRGGVMVLTLVAGLLIIASLVVIVVVAPGAYEN